MSTFSKVILAIIGLALVAGVWLTPAFTAIAVKVAIEKEKAIFYVTKFRQTIILSNLKTGEIYSLKKCEGKQTKYCKYRVDDCINKQ